MDLEQAKEQSGQFVSRSEFESTMIALATDLRFIRETMVTKEEAKGFATKEDLSPFATKEDLSPFATKRDFAEIKEEMKVLKEELTHEFKAAVEIITDEMRGAHKDEIAVLQSKRDEHEERITTLEQHAGLRA